MSTQRPAFPIPKTLADGRYELKTPLGVGGMAAVYRAIDHWTGQDRAVKILLPAAARNPKTVARFLTEARTMTHLDHPNIIRIYDVGHDDDDIYYFAMEVAGGGSLISLLRSEGTCGPARGLGLIFQALRGLAHAHAAGVIHRDVKPHNMLLDDEGTLKLTDFGIARVVATHSDARITSTGDTLGTLAYMAPEQRLDARSVTTAVDIYGAGATLYLLTTGRRPMELAIAGIDKRVLGRVPPPVRGVVRKSTAVRPEDRYSSCRAMAQDIAEVLDRLYDDDTDEHFEGRMMDFDASEDTTLVRVDGQTAATEGGQ